MYVYVMHIYIYRKVTLMFYFYERHNAALVENAITIKMR